MSTSLSSRISKSEHGDPHINDLTTVGHLHEIAEEIEIFEESSVEDEGPVNISSEISSFGKFLIIAAQRQPKSSGLTRVLSAAATSGWQWRRMFVAKRRLCAGNVILLPFLLSSAAIWGLSVQQQNIFDRMSLNPKLQNLITVNKLLNKFAAQQFGDLLDNLQRKLNQTVRRNDIR